MINIYINFMQIAGLTLICRYLRARRAAATVPRAACRAARRDASLFNLYGASCGAAAQLAVIKVEVAPRLAPWEFNLNLKVAR